MSQKSSKQSIIADSPTDVAEYITESNAANKVIWINKVVTELGVVHSITNLVDLYCDNNGAIRQVKESRSHKKFNHILRR